MKFFLKYFIFSTFACSSVYAQTNTRLISAWKKFNNDIQLRHASYSLSVVDVKTGQVVFSQNGDVGLAPASTLKAITSITSLYQLGADYRFKTGLKQTGQIENGTLKGDLILTGANDPSLGSWRWEETKEQAVLTEFVDAIRKAGIKKISGSVIGAGENHYPPGWIYQDLGNYYGSAPNELCWRENQYDIHLSPGRAGQPVRMVKTVPQINYLQYKNELRTGRAGSGDNAYARLPVNNSLVYLQGSYALDQSKRRISAALPDPAFEAALRLTDTLNRLGITVSGKPQSKKPDSSALVSLAVHQSPPLSALIYWLNKKSINLYAEQLLRQTGDSAKTDNPIKYLQTFWQQKGIDSLSLNMKDGSGLSPGNRVTTNSLASILQKVRQENWFPAFYESLPVYNDMHMKSGSISDVLAYAGYQTNATGQEVSFSLIVNNYSGSTSAIRKKMFVLLDALK